MDVTPPVTTPVTPHISAATVTAPATATDSKVRRDPVVVSVTAAIAEPFEPGEIKFKPQMVKNNRCLAMAYIDARLIQDRLDDVLGPENWEDAYDLLPDGSVMCKLRLKLGGDWITKIDVGSPSEQPDSGDRLKAAFSDALKRAAVKFGIGRYLYRLPAQWVDYDPVKKQITQVPQLPAFAMPKKKGPAQLAKTAPSKPADAPKQLPARTESKPASESDKCQGLPTTGAELYRRLQEYDRKLAAESLCAAGALVSHVTQAGIKAGYANRLVAWVGEPAMKFAVEETRKFEQDARAQKSTAA
jgi:hypothetical protein